MHFSLFSVLAMLRIITIMPGDNCVSEAGGHLNKKDGLARYGDAHVKDKTS